MGISRQLLLAAVLLLTTARSPAELSLGPVDDITLLPKALDRVALGEVAPDFRLYTHTGEIFQLSHARGARDVVLVFYRGHW